MKKSLLEKLRFDEAEHEFELLETESGNPGFFGGWSDRETAENAAAPEPPPSASVEENEQRLRQEYRVDINPDILLRRFMLGGKILALTACINGMADGSQINDFILRQGMAPGCMDGAGAALAQFAVDHVFAQQEAALSNDWAEVKKAISEGRTAVFLEGDAQTVLMDTRGFERRSVGTPQNEKVIRGPQEGFTENIRTNITLLRRIIKTDDFICEFQNAGGKNNVVLVIAYRESVVNPRLLAEVKRKLQDVDTHMILNDGTLEQLTERYPLSPLPQVLNTERPDRVAAHIMQGHVAVLCEGSPSANIMPATLFSLMATPEDSYMRRPLGSVLRVVRYIGAALSVLLPGYFIAIALYHQGMMSTEVISTIIASRQMVFLPLPIEMIFLLWVFQLLREAGIRVPGSVGHAIGIIGGLILGQAAVAANMVSTVVLIIVALAGMGNFTIPDYSTQIAAEYFRTILVLLGWAGGLLGLLTGIVLTAAWMASLKSYGVPFLTPVAPKTYSIRPAILRGPITQRGRSSDYMNTREGGTK